MRIAGELHDTLLQVFLAASMVLGTTADVPQGVQENACAQHLRELERDGLVIRKDLSNRVLHVEYSLSDSGGLAVLRLISMLRDWSNEHLPFGGGREERVNLTNGVSGMPRT